MKKTLALTLAVVLLALSFACAKPAATEAAPAGDYSDPMIVPGVDLAVEEYAIGFRLGSTAVTKVNEATAAPSAQAPRSSPPQPTAVRWLPLLAQAPWPRPYWRAAPLFR